MLKFHEVRWFEAYNSSLYTVPAHGLVEIVEAAYADTVLVNGTANVRLEVTRPTADSVTPFAVNSWKPIPSQRTGLVALQGPVVCEYAASGFLTAGDTIGPQTGSFLPKEDGPLQIIGLVELSPYRYLVEFAPGNSAGGIGFWSLNQAHVDLPVTTSSESVGPPTAEGMCLIRNVGDTTNAGTHTVNFTSRDAIEPGVGAVSSVAFNGAYQSLIAFSMYIENNWHWYLFHKNLS